MPNIGFSNELIKEIGAKYKGQTDDSGTDLINFKGWLRERIVSYLSADRQNAADKTAHQTASDAADVAIAARESAWDDLDAAKAAALNKLRSDLNNGVS